LAEIPVDFQRVLVQYRVAAPCSARRWRIARQAVVGRAAMAVQWGLVNDNDYFSNR
jgi:hypothetical protein